MKTFQTCAAFLLLLCFAGRVQAEMVMFLKPGDVIQITSLGQGSTPYALNNHGDIVGQDINGQATLWRNGQQITLGSRGGATSIARVINDNGTIAGQADIATGLYKATEWTIAAPLVAINLDPTSGLSSSVLAMNNNGTKAGFRTNGTIHRSHIWGDQSSPSTYLQGAQVFGSGDHKATGINDDGEIVGVDLARIGGFYHNGIDGFGGFTSGLGTGYLPTAGINNNQVTAGTRADVAYLQRIGDISESIIDLPGGVADSAILGLNDNDILVGRSFAGSSLGEGIAFDLSTGRALNLNDFMRSGFAVDSILSLHDINEQNEFVGIAHLAAKSSASQDESQRQYPNQVTSV